MAENTRQWDSFAESIETIVSPGTRFFFEVDKFPYAIAVGIAPASTDFGDNPYAPYLRFYYGYYVTSNTAYIIKNGEKAADSKFKIERNFRLFIYVEASSVIFVIVNAEGEEVFREEEGFAWFDHHKNYKVFATHYEYKDQIYNANFVKQAIKSGAYIDAPLPPLEAKLSEGQCAFFSADLPPLTAVDIVARDGRASTAKIDSELPLLSVTASEGSVAVLRAMMPGVVLQGVAVDRADADISAIKTALPVFALKATANDATYIKGAVPSLSLFATTHDPSADLEIADIRCITPGMSAAIKTKAGGVARIESDLWRGLLSSSFGVTEEEAAGAILRSKLPFLAVSAAVEEIESAQFVLPLPSLSVQIRLNKAVVPDPEEPLPDEPEEIISGISGGHLLSLENSFLFGGGLLFAEAGSLGLDGSLSASFNLSATISLAAEFFGSEAELVAGGLVFFEEETFVSGEIFGGASEQTGSLLFDLTNDFLRGEIFGTANGNGDILFDFEGLLQGTLESAHVWGELTGQLFAESSLLIEGAAGEMSSLFLDGFEIEGRLESFPAGKIIGTLPGFFGFIRAGSECSECIPLRWIRRPQ